MNHNWTLTTHQVGEVLKALRKRAQFIRAGRRRGHTTELDVIETLALIIDCEAMIEHGRKEGSSTSKETV